MIVHTIQPHGPAPDADVASSQLQQQRQQQQQQRTQLQNHHQQQQSANTQPPSQSQNHQQPTPQHQSEKGPQTPQPSSQQLQQNLSETSAPKVQTQPSSQAEQSSSITTNGNISNGTSNGVTTTPVIMPGQSQLLRGVASSGGPPRNGGNRTGNATTLGAQPTYINLLMAGIHEFLHRFNLVVDGNYAVPPMDPNFVFPLLAPDEQGDPDAEPYLLTWWQLHCDSMVNTNPQLAEAANFLPSQEIAIYLQGQREMRDPVVGNQNSLQRKAMAASRQANLISPSKSEFGNPHPAMGPSPDHRRPPGLPAHIQGRPVVPGSSQAPNQPTTYQGPQPVHSGGNGLQGGQQPLIQPSPRNMPQASPAAQMIMQPGSGVPQPGPSPYMGPGQGGRMMQLQNPSQVQMEEAARKNFFNSIFTQLFPGRDPNSLTEAEHSSLQLRGNAMWADPVQKNQWMEELRSRFQNSAQLRQQQLQIQQQQQLQLQQAQAAQAAHAQAQMYGGQRPIRQPSGQFQMIPVSGPPLNGGGQDQDPGNSQNQDQQSGPANKRARRRGTTGHSPSNPATSGAGSEPQGQQLVQQSPQVPLGQPGNKMPQQSPVVPTGPMGGRPYNPQQQATQAQQAHVAQQQAVYAAMQRGELTPEQFQMQLQQSNLIQRRLSGLHPNAQSPQLDPRMQPIPGFGPHPEAIMAQMHAGKISQQAASEALRYYHQGTGRSGALLAQYSPQVPQGQLPHAGMKRKLGSDMEQQQTPMAGPSGQMHPAFLEMHRQQQAQAQAQAAAQAQAQQAHAQSQGELQQQQHSSGNQPGYMNPTEQQHFLSTLNGGMSHVMQQGGPMDQRLAAMSHKAQMNRALQQQQQQQMLEAAQQQAQQQAHAHAHAQASAAAAAAAAGSSPTSIQGRPGSAQSHQGAQTPQQQPGGKTSAPSAQQSLQAATPQGNNANAAAKRGNFKVPAAKVPSNQKKAAAAQQAAQQQQQQQQAVNDAAASSATPTTKPQTSGAGAQASAMARPATPSETPIAEIITPGIAAQQQQQQVSLPSSLADLASVTQFSLPTSLDDLSNLAAVTGMTINTTTSTNNSQPPSAGIDFGLESDLFITDLDLTSMNDFGEEWLQDMLNGGSGGAGAGGVVGGSELDLGQGETGGAEGGI
ncbi:uncharacterized protein EV422DRAFT_613483 [Fimicolochytrium jonesii]|uniref:uncharacterized protein n=1 Tax=Fimicolochytrium jonesii TaxID=1396493 RepID=UPI0022FDE8B6|nr:uncharacterized protein EV422DRAFT_613483 [Fimicolochytrium jonesii]KAI8822418.1 hypothetical protein EV422DRAFT_613483 [Fimicolochytrium jonesii]